MEPDDLIEHNDLHDLKLFLELLDSMNCIKSCGIDWAACLDGASRDMDVRMDIEKTKANLSIVLSVTLDNK